MLICYTEVEVYGMNVLSPSRPDLVAHREATALPFPKLVGELVRSIGKKLTAYIAGVKDVRALDRWMEGAAPYKNAQDRLRFAYRVVKTLERHDRANGRSGLAHGSQPRVERPRSDLTFAGRRSGKGRP